MTFKVFKLPVRKVQRWNWRGVERGENCRQTVIRAEQRPRLPWVAVGKEPGHLVITLGPFIAQSEQLDFTQCWSLGLSFPIYKRGT